MVRDEPLHPGGPTTADVHRDELFNFALQGWKVAKPTEPPNSTTSNHAGALPDSEQEATSLAAERVGASVSNQDAATELDTRVSQDTDVADATAQAEEPAQSADQDVTQAPPGAGDPAPTGRKKPVNKP